MNWTFDFVIRICKVIADREIAATAWADRGMMSLYFPCAQVYDLTKKGEKSV